MKLFLDTANIEEIKLAAQYGVIDGVTTNPTLIAKEGKDFEETIKEICKIINGPISAEVISENSAGMVKEGKALFKIDEKHIVIKVPICIEGLKAAYELSQEDIPVNMTLIFSPNQALLACKAGARYISPFVGRLDDIGHDGVKVAVSCQNIVDTYDFDTEVIAASVRHPAHVQQCAEEGIDIATVPYKVLMSLLNHPLTDIGIEQFMKDWKQK
jgi:transaldolase